jgi:hypothetical protein
MEYHSNTSILKDGSTSTTSILTEPPRSIITMVSTMLTLWALAIMAVPLVVFTMLMGLYKSAIVLAVLVTAINVICILKTMSALTVLLGQSSVVTRALRKVGLVKQTKSGGKVFSSSEIYPMVPMSHTGSQLKRYEGNMGEDINASLRGDK